jgi:hypothetical protein
MKRIFSIGLVSMLLLSVNGVKAQDDKSKRPSPPALASQKVGNVTIKIDYSQPSVKGRTIGSDLEPTEGKVWRTGANEATVFEVDQDVTVEGKALPKGKYGLFTLVNDGTWTIIFNKTWNQWGAFTYKESADVLRVNVKPGKADPFAEKMTFVIEENGKVNLLWGDIKVSFTVK